MKAAQTAGAPHLHRCLAPHGARLVFVTVGGGYSLAAPPHVVQRGLLQQQLAVETAPSVVRDAQVRELLHTVLLQRGLLLQEQRALVVRRRHLLPQRAQHDALGEARRPHLRYRLDARLDVRTVAQMQPSHASRWGVWYGEGYGEGYGVPPLRRSWPSVHRRPDRHRPWRRRRPCAS
jgi:hypothetical protein